MPNLVMGEVTNDCKYIYPEADKERFRGKFSLYPYLIICRQDFNNTFSEEEKELARICEAENEINYLKSREATEEIRMCNKNRYAPEKEKEEKIKLKNEKLKQNIETKCSIQSGKAQTDFSAKLIYENCLENNNYYKK